MRLVRGVELTPDQYRQVADAYVNWNQSGYWKTQDKFIKRHAFYFTKSGKLAGNRHHAEPAFMANWEDEDRKVPKRRHLR